MNRRTYLRTAGAAVSLPLIAGCAAEAPDLTVIEVIDGHLTREHGDIVVWTDLTNTGTTTLDTYVRAALYADNTRLTEPTWDSFSPTRGKYTLPPQVPTRCTFQWVRKASLTGITKASLEFKTTGAVAPLQNEHRTWVEF